jgi:hypothetical protein
MRFRRSFHLLDLVNDPCLCLHEQPLRGARPGEGSALPALTGTAIKPELLFFFSDSFP